MLSHVLLFATLWTIACRATLSVGFFRQEYWSGLPFPPDPGIKPKSPALAGGFFTPEPPGKPMTLGKITKIPLCLSFHSYAIWTIFV